MAVLRQRHGMHTDQMGTELQGQLGGDFDPCVDSVITGDMYDDGFVAHGPLRGVSRCTSVGVRRIGVLMRVINRDRVSRQ